MARSHRTKSILLFSIAALALLICAAGALLIREAFRSVEGERDVWLAASGKPVPDRFRIAMFQPDDDSAIDGGRVILNTWGELNDASDTFTVFDAAGTEHDIPKNTLGFECPPGLLPDRLARLNATIVRWGDETDMQLVEITHHPASDETPEVWRLKILWKAGGHDAFYYTIEDGAPRPIRWTAGHWPD